MVIKALGATHSFIRPSIPSRADRLVRRLTPWLIQPLLGGLSDSLLRFMPRWLVESIMDSSTHSLVLHWFLSWRVGWGIDWLTHWLTRWIVHSLVDWIADTFANSVNESATDSLIGLSINWLGHLLFHRFAALSPDSFADWRAHALIDSSPAWWIIDRFLGGLFVDLSWFPRRFGDSSVLRLTRWWIPWLIRRLSSSSAD